MLACVEPDYNLVSTNWIMKPPLPSRISSPWKTSITNWSHHMCTGAMLPNMPFAHLKITSLLGFAAPTRISHSTCGTACSPKQNLPSISFAVATAAPNFLPGCMYIHDTFDFNCMPLLHPAPMSWPMSNWMHMAVGHPTAWRGGTLTLPGTPTAVTPYGLQKHTQPASATPSHSSPPMYACHLPAPLTTSLLASPTLCMPFNHLPLMHHLPHSATATPKLCIS